MKRSAAISATTGLRVVASTGIHREAHYPDGHPLRALTAQARAALFVRDLTERHRQDLRGRKVLLIGAGIAAILPSTQGALNNPGEHGLSEILYAYASASNNNGSAFAGVEAG
mgnify:CR=1 FL=1